ncbi:MAG: sulfurtransferase [Gammaproteobacteria bacterium]|nr:sulfurtransferase [Gammaproteobacteria bacterium]
MIQPIAAQQLQEWLARDSEQPVVLDVREAWELQKCALPQATHIPMGQIPARVGELDKNADIVVMCHHGMRSFQVANYLARVGFGKVYNLTGGIHAWATQVDPNMAKY